MTKPVHKAWEPAVVRSRARHRSGTLSILGMNLMRPAPAQKVVVTDQLNLSTDDLATFSLGPDCVTQPVS